jgi:hypothetical protein
MAVNNSNRKKTSREQTPIIPPVNPNIINVLSANWIKTLFQGISIRITDGAMIYFTAPIANICAWQIEGNRIQIIGPETVILQFASNSEAMNGLNRLVNCLNGLLVT